ncbi:MAG TPA: FAD-binding protein [Actinocrinis sp.]|jgi:FAD/FMN-containing dehydrogenase|uniref:FAD-binding protein n=1 Tax=Actinocrinis sp. TaxID=1920516 RepID=UPI002DDCB38D|nr:FAD-binding protein [Actinocrinis sp.]HEV3171514.1 FAD-binding protein [Actinocrinis sp.]
MDMRAQPSRRSFVRAVSLGALVVGFDGATRAWAAAGSPAAGLDRVPTLDGRLLFDPAELAPFEDDFGHIIHRTPRAVLEPGSVRDIAEMVEFCGPRRIPVAPRGQGHQTFGQAQVDGGLVIDLTPLNAITVDPVAGTVSAGAGALWHAVLNAALAQGLTPPVFTDYIELSIGGTLSAGGIGGATQHHGAQVDTVIDLDIVTGTGDLRTCSATQDPDLFHAALAGLGQVGVITRATIQLVPAPTSVRQYNLTYPTADALTAAQRKVVLDGRFDWLEGAVNPVTGGGWQYVLEGAKYYDATPPDDNALIGDLAFQGPPQIQDFAYADFINVLAPAVAFLQSTGEWYDPHPWLNLFLPDAATDGYVTTAMAGLTTADIGASGVVLLYPVPTAKLTAPLLRVPDGELTFLFAVLRTAAPDTGALPAATMVADNRTMFLQAQSVGGTQYPVGSIPMTHADWRIQYGAQWPFFASAKERFDPYGILTPGQGIFSENDQ